MSFTIIVPRGSRSRVRSRRLHSHTFLDLFQTVMPGGFPSDAWTEGLHFLPGLGRAEVLGPEGEAAALPGSRAIDRAARIAIPEDAIVVRLFD